MKVSRQGAKAQLMNPFSCKSCAAAIILLMTNSLAVAATEVKLHERVASDSPVVRLGDVADIKTDDVEEQRRLAKLLLMPAPAPGTQRFVRQREVQDVLAAHGEDLGRLRIVGANQIEVSSPVVTEQSTQRNADRSPIDRQAVLAAGRM